MNEIEKDEELKNQAIGWAVALPTILIALAAGAGVFSLLIGLCSAVAVMFWRLKKNECKEVTK